MLFQYLVVVLVVGVLACSACVGIFTNSYRAFAQDIEGTQYQVVEGTYSNKEVGLRLGLPDSLKGFVYEIEHGKTKGLTIQIHPEVDVNPATCCPSIDSSPAVFLLTSDSLDMLSSPDPLSGDLYAAFQGYNMRLSIERVGDNQVLVATINSDNSRTGLDNVSHLGKFYLLNNDERFVTYGLWATKEKYQKYLSQFEESAKSLSIENAKPVDLRSLFSRYAYQNIEGLPSTESKIHPQIVTPSIINSVTLDKDANTIAMNFTESNGNSFLILNSGDLVKGPHHIMLDGKTVESTTLRNEDSEYLVIFYNQTGDHQLTVTGTEVIPEFDSIVIMISAVGIFGVFFVTKIQTFTNKYKN